MTNPYIYGYYGFLPSIVTYLQQCPYCHVIHENKVEAQIWCEEHADKKSLWDNRKSARVVWNSWACPGCPQCEEETQ